MIRPSTLAQDARNGQRVANGTAAARCALPGQTWRGILPMSTRGGGVGRGGQSPICCNGSTMDRTIGAMSSVIPGQAGASVPAVVDGAPVGPNPAVVYLASVAPGTRPAARQALGVVAGIVAPGVAWDSLPYGRLRHEHIAAIRAKLAGRYAPSTANKCLYYLRGVLRAAWRLGQIGAEDLARALDIEPVKGQRLPAGRDIAPAEIAALFATCDGSTVGIRDRAILTVLRHGLRRAEVAALDLADIDLEAGAILVQHGKGNKARAVPLHPEAVEVLRAWIAARGGGGGPLFVNTNGDGKGKRPGGRLSDQVIYELVKRRAKRAGLERSISLHDWRRTLAGDLLDAGIDLPTVAGIMGHSSVEVTARYDRRPAEVRRAAMARIALNGDKAG